ncbi:hypothetical protein EXIGLDRAFT_327652 [Exidia glandulosa HHB12029]|uniref:WSC domain-containing protein n=1 Tax=Exidia glandulosa HHB12029 TaxID=1314781 RepID=A0A165LP55_EXIGL|nr:hypothetical protein EXIGLDRAFT_327652 [Exidia glandulosa HHB12029]
MKLLAIVSLGLLCLAGVLASTWEENRLQAVLDRARDAPLPEGWRQLSACSIDHGQHRVFAPYSALAIQHHLLLKNTPNTCLQRCASGGFGYASVTNGNECWCSASEPVIDEKSSWNCNKPCSGDKSQNCGGRFHSAVYAHHTLPIYPALASALGNNAPVTWPIIHECLKDTNLGKSVLQEPIIVIYLQLNTPHMCTALCSSKQMPFAGVEDSGKCLCSKALLPDVPMDRFKKPKSECNMACTGNSQMGCGGEERLTLLRDKHWQRYGNHVQ